MSPDSQPKRHDKTRTKQNPAGTNTFDSFTIDFWIIRTKNAYTYLELPDAIPGYPLFVPFVSSITSFSNLSRAYQVESLVLLYSIPSHDPCIEEKLSTPQPTQSTSSAHEIIQANRVVLTTSRHPPIAQTHTGCLLYTSPSPRD